MEQQGDGDIISSVRCGVQHRSSRAGANYFYATAHAQGPRGLLVGKLSSCPVELLSGTEYLHCMPAVECTWHACCATQTRATTDFSNCSSLNPDLGHSRIATITLQRGAQRTDATSCTKPPTCDQQTGDLSTLQRKGGGSRCHFTSCRYAHVCVKCKGDHQVSECPRGSKSGQGCEATQERWNPSSSLYFGDLAWR